MRRKLFEQDLNEEFCQKLINNAPDGKEIILERGAVRLIIKNTSNQIGYTSFRERYSNYRGQ